MAVVVAHPGMAAPLGMAGGWGAAGSRSESRGKAWLLAGFATLAEQLAAS